MNLILEGNRTRVRTWESFIGLGFVLLAPFGCGGEPSLECGSGTVEKDGKCVVDSPSGSGGKSSTGDGDGEGDGDASGGRTDEEDTDGEDGSGGDESTTDDGSGGDESTTDDGSGGDETSGGEGGLGGGANDPLEAVYEALLDCGSRDVTGATVVSGVITSDTTWSGLVHVSGDLSVRNEATLTIEPGTKIIVAHDAGIEFGWNESEPTLSAEGTIEDPILFCAEANSSGYWKGLHFLPTTQPASVLKNVLIENAGSSDAGAAAALTLEAPVLLRGVQVVGSGTSGIEAWAIDPESDYLWIEGSAEHAAIIRSAQGAHLPTGAQFSENDDILVDIEALQEDLVLNKFAAPYSEVLLGGVEPHLATFGAGVEVTSTLDVGAHRLKVRGTEALPVKLPYVWLDGEQTHSLEYVEIGEGDDDNGSLRLWESARITLKHATIAGYIGVYDSADFSSSSVDITVQAEPGERAGRADNCAAFKTFPEISSEGWVNVGCDRLPSGKLPRARVNYRWGGRLTLEDEDTLELVDQAVLLQSLQLQAGAVILRPGSSLEVWGNVNTSQGTAFEAYEGSTITLLGTNDFYGIHLFSGRFFVQGSAEKPVRFKNLPEDMRLSDEWGIYLGSSDVHIDHAIFEAPGHSNLGGAGISTDRPISISNSTIVDPPGAGFRHRASDTTDYAGNGNDLGTIVTY